MWENPLFCGRCNHIVVWTWLLDHAVWKEKQVMFSGEITTLQAGQLTCGSGQISADTGVPSSSVRRILQQLKNEQLIDQQVSNKASLITVKKWNMYQGDDRQDEQQMSSRRSADDRQVITKEERKKDKKEKKDKNNEPLRAPGGAQSAQVVDEMEVEFRKFIAWLNEKNILKSQKQWTEKAQKKWNRRRKEFEAQVLAKAFANLQNDPRGWWIENNGFRPLHWWLDKEDRIHNLLNCHICSSAKAPTTHVSV